ncbi:hypothetical protein KKG56_03645 [bacterium]|nr:hypothetical protein [bacterium]
MNACLHLQQCGIGTIPSTIIHFLKRIKKPFFQEAMDIIFSFRRFQGQGFDWNSAERDEIDTKANDTTAVFSTNLLLFPPFCDIIIEFTAAYLPQASATSLLSDYQLITGNIT